MQRYGQALGKVKRQATPLWCVVAIDANTIGDQFSMIKLHKETIMPSGKGSYGSKVGRPKKKKRKTKK